ncbi:MAG: hypothetical protein LBG80_20815 [Bacteroidales bacterium]|jgi:hypothetical protein|nr:hypothetical protein [Bacteroidales bacterium]
MKSLNIKLLVRIIKSFKNFKTDGSMGYNRANINMYKKLFIFSFLIVFCGNIYGQEFSIPREYIKINIDAYSIEEFIPATKKVLLVCNDVTIPKHDIKNIEFEKYIKNLLSPKGYTFTANENEANIVIFYEYGISDPKEYTTQKVVPIWGQTGIAKSTTRTYTNSSGKPYTITKHTPSYGKVGERVETTTQTKYMRWINISAFDADFYRKTGEDKMLWLIEINSEGKNDDLRAVFPVMLAGAKPYIEKNTGEKIKTEIFSDSYDVLQLKGTLFISVIFTKKNKKNRDPEMVVYEDVYKNNELFIKAGTSVSASRNYWEISILSTTSVNNEKIELKGDYSVWKKVIKEGTIVRRGIVK